MSAFKVGDKVQGYTVFSVRADGHDYHPQGIHVQARNERGEYLRFSQGGCFCDRDDTLKPEGP
jgi:hypothetical protein